MSNEAYEHYFSFKTRMLYSALVDADFLDTELFMNDGKVDRKKTKSIEELTSRAERFIEDHGFLNSSGSNLMIRRAGLLKECIEIGKISEPGFFRLVAGTGEGKTVSSLLFALEHAKKNGMDRVIYLLPYTSIIEQNSKVLKTVLGEENVLEHHSNYSFPQDEELKHLQLAAENWDIPIIITTNMQFFESFYASRSSRCRKLHNVANSVIILDECQGLPVDFLKPCLEVVNQLVAHYHTSAVFSTATQPALEALLRDVRFTDIQFNPSVEKEKLFSTTNLDCLEISDLIQMLQRESQALCIVNTRALAQEIFGELKDDSSAFCLTTLMTPIHRSQVISQIQNRLKKKEKCLVISTSLIEAGVDLDFECVYRQTGSLDSYIQAAGRVNREGKRDSNDCYLKMFSVPNEIIPDDLSLPISVTKSLLSAETDNFFTADVINKYFAELFALKGMQLDAEGILDLFHLNDMKFRTASRKMHLIHDEGAQLIVPDETLQKSLQKLNQGKAQKEDFRFLQKHSVQISERLEKKLKSKNCIRDIQGVNDLYILENPDLYDLKVGLRTDGY